MSLFGKVLKITLLIFTSLVILGLILLINPIRTILSIKKADGLYTMTYYGNYNFYIKKVDDYYFKKPKTEDINGCSLFAAFGDLSNPIFGRNNDNFNVPIMVTRCNPLFGYSSIAVSRINILGFEKDLSKKLPTLSEKIKLLAVPDMVFDGMNECGVVVGGASILDTTPEVNIDKHKESVSGCYLLRQILDYAKNTDEAVKIAKRYNITDETCSFSAHLLIADPSGHSVILEYFNGELQAISNKEPWQVLTNFQISGMDLKNSLPCYRYNSAYKQLKEAKGKINAETGMNILKGLDMMSPVFVPRQWSTVYDMKKLTMYLSIYGDYKNIRSFTLKP